MPLLANETIHFLQIIETVHVAGVEMFGKKKRETAGICLHFFFAIGVALTAVIAWYTRDWVPTQLAISSFPILFVVYYW